MAGREEKTRCPPGHRGYMHYGWTFRMDARGSFLVEYPASQFPGLEFVD